MDDELQTTREIDHKTELLLSFNATRIQRLESALEKNWLAHLVLAGVGLAFVLDVGNFPAFFANYFTRGQYDKKALAAIVLAVLLYYFMKLGHLLTAYIDASRSQEWLLKRYWNTGECDDMKTMSPHKSTNFFVEAFFSLDVLTPHNQFSPYLIVTTVVVSAAQAAALFYFVQAYNLNHWMPSILLSCEAVLVSLYVFGKSQRHQTAVVRVSLIALAVVALLAASIWGWPALILLLSGAALMTLYILFWNSQSDHRKTATMAVVVSLLLALTWLITFAAIGR